MGGLQEQIREEAKLEKDLKDAELKEEKYKKLLDKAKKEVGTATGEKLLKLQEQLKLLEEELAEAHEKNQRAKSMAEQTKAGHVYVISNIGAFGESVYKIGMTRRLEPLDRVKELGDASVPFTFDVHAMIYSDNAPSLENFLHKRFDRKRLNLVNARKEFFKVSLDDIEKEALMHNSEAVFIKLAEAKDFRETLAIRLQVENKKQLESQSAFPDEI